MKTQQLFNEIAARYDLMNTLISLGLDKGWRKRALNMLCAQSRETVLDLGSGTCDLACELANSTRGTTVVSVDPAMNMLSIGKQKLADQQIPTENSPLICGNGLHLPFKDCSFDKAISAFCVRNIDNRPLLSAEVSRVLKPNGQFIILDLWKPDSKVLATLCRIYNSTVLPLTGALLSKKGAYEYLAQSIDSFPPAGEIAAIFSKDFSCKGITPLSGGIVTILSLEKRPSERGEA